MWFSTSLATVWLAACAMGVRAADQAQEDEVRSIPVCLTVYELNDWPIANALVAPHSLADNGTLAGLGI